MNHAGTYDAGEPSGAPHPRFARLADFLSLIPAVEVNDMPGQGIGSGESGGAWWVRFSIDIDHELAWETVQELGHVLNYLAMEERLPTVFKPVSPPPYMNGGPEEYLSWVIECPDATSPDVIAGWLEERLPKPVDDEAAWRGESEDDDVEDDDADEDSPDDFADDEEDD
jgi:hypothetical protein